MAVCDLTWGRFTTLEDISIELNESKASKSGFPVSQMVHRDYSKDEAYIVIDVCLCLPNIYESHAKLTARTSPYMKDSICAMCVAGKKKVSCHGPFKNPANRMSDANHD